MTRSRAMASVDDWLAGKGRRLWLWDDNGPRSLTGVGGETPNGIRIGPVYTPPSDRGQGYASALVAAVSQAQLDAGRRFCFLYADLANPTSNKIYQAIGYRPITDALRIDFAEPSMQAGSWRRAGCTDGAGADPDHRAAGHVPGEWRRTAHLHGEGPLVDGFGRTLRALRVSVTDACQFRCLYCMPSEDMTFLPHGELLTPDEIERLVGLMVGWASRTSASPGASRSSAASCPRSWRAWRPWNPTA